MHKTNTSLPDRIIRFIPLAVLLTGAAISILVWHTSTSEQDREMRAAFHYESGKLMTQLVDNLQKQEAIIANLRSFYAGYVQVVRDVFELYTSFPTVLSPGVQAIYYSPKVTSVEYEGFALNARMEGYLGYSIYPEGQREVYYPVLYVVPVRENEKALGYDILTDPVRADAVNTAIGRDSIISSTKTRLVAANDSGFVLVAPIFHAGTPEQAGSERNAGLQGIISVEVLSNEFFDEVGKSGGTEHYVELEVFDNEAVSSGSRLFSSKTNGDPLIQSDIPITFGGRVFLMRLNSSKEFERAHRSSYPDIILVQGIVISILLGMCAFLLLVHTSLLSYFRKSEQNK